MGSGHDVVLVDFTDPKITWTTYRNIIWLKKKFNVTFLNIKITIQLINLCQSGSRLKDYNNLL
jgi:hypothetical protein